MTADPCPCFLKEDLEMTSEKHVFLKEYYLPIIDERFDTLSYRDLACCLCLIKSVLKSIEQGCYNCSNQELADWNKKREMVIFLLI